jgi:hypothetical protein
MEAALYTLAKAIAINRTTWFALKSQSAEASQKALAVHKAAQPKPLQLLRRWRETQQRFVL